jgi:hypothetical protein
MVAVFGAYTRSMGRPFLFFMILIMIPLATTEIGTDGWITSIMEGVAAGKFHAGWILVYTSIIMVIMRFFAGPIVHAISPLGLLAVSAGLAIVGLYTLSFTAGMAIFVAATVYGFGKTFFWPTMLGVVSEQTPKGGAMTLNAISGIGMLAVGVLGFPYIGSLQAAKNIEAIANTSAAKSVPGLVTSDGKLSDSVLDDRHIYEVIHYKVVNDTKLAAMTAMLPADKKAEITSASAGSSQHALKNMAVFPGIMLAGYIILIGYFVSRGGYKAQVLTGHAAEDKRFTGGVAGPVEA